MENSERDGDTRSSYLPPEKFVCSQEVMVRTLYETTDLFKTEKEVQCDQTAYCQLVYLTSIKLYSHKMTVFPHLFFSPSNPMENMEARRLVCVSQSFTVC